MFDVDFAIPPGVHGLELLDVIARSQPPWHSLLSDGSQHLARFKPDQAALGAVGDDQTLVPPRLAGVRGTEDVVVNPHFLGRKRIALVVFFLPSPWRSVTVIRAGRPGG